MNEKITGKIGDIGFFGNVWIRQNLLENVGDSNGNGHKHKFDHVSLLTQGKVEVQIEGYEPKVFSAPTFIVVRKEHKHKFTALEPNTVWYCVFAIRDLDGQPIDELFDPTRHDPMSSGIAEDDYSEKAQLLETLTTTETKE